jgi:hypothetical protein
MAKGKKAKSYLGKAASFAVRRGKKNEEPENEQQARDTPRVRDPSRCSHAA